jgi:hypothetical protein
MESNFNMLLMLLGRSNPTFFLGPAQKDLSIADRTKVLKHLSSNTIYADEKMFDSAVRAAGLNPGVRPGPKIIRPPHVFPVYDEVSENGFVVPLELKFSRFWEVSDAFGTFGYGGQFGSSLDGLLALLGVVENVWQSKYGSVLPARWLRAFHLRLLCPVHIDLIEGESLQVPLLLSVLRALGSSTSQGDAINLPFGSQPIFATGRVQFDDDGTFGEVQMVKEKIQGFVRELGSGWPALLTGLQLQELQKSPDLLQSVRWIEVNSVNELLGLEVINKGLQSLTDSYHPSLNEALVSQSLTLARQLQFTEVQRLSEWMLSQVRSPYYRFQFQCHMALILFHKGKFAAAWDRLENALEVFDKASHLMGVDDLGLLLLLACDMAIDAYEPKIFTKLLEKLGPDEMRQMSGTRCVQVFGSLCQFHRMFGDTRLAIINGEKAVSLADQAYASSAGRSRNYLVHARIVAVREGATNKKELLAKACRELNESMDDWAPVEDERTRSSHLGFCLHLEAEIARLSAKPFSPPDTAFKKGVWSHPWLFTLLSCARNKRNEFATRVTYINQLVSLSEKWCEEQGKNSLFGLFNAVYVLLAATFSKGDIAVPQKHLRKWLEDRAKEGYPGWQNHLMPLIKEKMNFEEAEILCDAIRYH